VVDPNQQIYDVDYCERLPVIASEIAKETQKDPVLKRAYQHTKCGWNSSVEDSTLEPYVRRSRELSIQKGCLLWGSRVVIPTVLHSMIVSELHEGHLGVVGMKSIARSFVWWPGLDKDLDNMARKCEISEDQKGRSTQVSPSHPLIYPENPWERVHCDFAEYSGKQYLLMVDAFSKWVEVHELGNHATIAQIMDAMRRSFSCHGLPQRLVSDNGPQFTAHEFQEFMRVNGIKHQLTPPYHPSSNGQAE
jgi:hypothetical protein